MFDRGERGEQAGWGRGVGRSYAPAEVLKGGSVLAE